MVYFRSNGSLLAVRLCQRFWLVLRQLLKLFFRSSSHTMCDNDYQHSSCMSCSQKTCTYESRHPLLCATRAYVAQVCTHNLCCVEDLNLDDCHSHRIRSRDKSYRYPEQHVFEVLSFRQQPVPTMRRQEKELYVCLRFLTKNLQT